MQFIFYSTANPPKRTRNITAEIIQQVLMLYVQLRMDLVFYRISTLYMNNRGYTLLLFWISGCVTMGLLQATARPVERQYNRYSVQGDAVTLDNFYIFELWEAL